MQKFEIRSTSTTQPAKGLFVSDVKATASQPKDIDAALRVGVRLATSDGDGAFYIYGPNNNATNSYTWTDGTDSTTTKAVTLAIVGKVDDTNSQLLDVDTEIPMAEETPTKVEIYIWYEGEDGKLYSDNYAANDLNVSVKFSSYGFDAS